MCRPAAAPEKVAPGQARRERLDQRVAAAAVGAAAAAQVAVVGAAGDEVGERELLERGQAVIERLARVEQAVAPRRRRDQPPEPQRGRERLGDRADVRDEVRPQPLQRADRRAVVAVLGVVVVLDDQHVVLGRPGEQLRPPLGAEHRAGRELVGGREQDRARVVRKLVDDDRRARRRASGTGTQAALGEEPADALVPRVLDRELDRPERLGERDERLPGARAQDHVVGPRDAPADPPAVGGDHLAQRRSRPRSAG